MGFLSWIFDVWTWLASPSVIPWAGAVAAIVAALTVAPRAWLRSPGEFVGRAIRVAAVWLLVVWLLSSAARFGSGRGSGNGTKNGPEAEPGEQTPTPPVVVIKPGPFPAGQPEHVDLVISFVPSTTDPLQAREFSCDLHVKGVDANASKIEIRAKDNAEFKRQLENQLRNVKLPPAPKRSTIRIRRSPFPGENILRQVKEMVEKILPDSALEFDE